VDGLPGPQTIFPTTQGRMERNVPLGLGPHRKKRAEIQINWELTNWGKRFQLEGGEKKKTKECFRENLKTNSRGWGTFSFPKRKGGTKKKTPPCEVCGGPKKRRPSCRNVKRVKRPKGLTKKQGVQMRTFGSGGLIDTKRVAYETNVGLLEVPLRFLCLGGGGRVSTLLWAPCQGPSRRMWKSNQVEIRKRTLGGVGFP